MVISWAITVVVTNMTLGTSDPQSQRNFWIELRTENSPIFWCRYHQISHQANENWATSI